MQEVSIDIFVTGLPLKSIIYSNESKLATAVFFMKEHDTNFSEPAFMPAGGFNHQENDSIEILFKEK